MHVTVHDIVTLRQNAFQVVAGKGGLGNRVDHIVTLDFEFTKHAATRDIDDYWAPHDFLVTTFQFAKDDPALVFDAVKKLRAFRTAGIAIKNVYSLDIADDLVRFADNNDYPIVLITDEHMFAEDLVIYVDGLLRSVTDGNLAERKINYILKGDVGKNLAKKTLLEINYTFMNGLFAVYFLPKEAESARRHSFLLSSETKRIREASGSAIVKFRDGFFYIHSTSRPKEIKRDDLVEKICVNLGIQRRDFHIGMGEVQFNLDETKKALLQALYAAAYARIWDYDACTYGDLGLYRLVFPFMGEEWAVDYRNAILGPLEKHDASSKMKLLDFALVYEQYRGNIQAVASHLDAHENTVRYRIGRIRKIAGFDEDDERFDEQLFTAIKLHRIKSVLGDDFSNLDNRIAYAE
ncbi:PucR family transcriptional regulator [Synergistaceae bacterium OttesenSCG-928-I11]|nr:PucR family transcriptional regulator [Synergistaceae bacterium OttesenSCG-928-I11]